MFFVYAVSEDICRLAMVAAVAGIVLMSSPILFAILSAAAA